MIKKMLCRITVGILFASCVTDNSVDIDYIPVKTGDKWGYVSRDGQYLINPQFDYADIFIGDLAIVKQDEKYGFIDRKGQILNGAMFKDVTPFSEGKAWVVTENKAPSLIDSEGNLLLEMKTAEQAYSFSDGLACVGIKNNDTEKTLYGYINAKGEWVITPQFATANDFSEGLAAVGFDSKDGSRIEFGYINKNGKLVIPCQFASAEQFTAAGTTIVALCNKDSYNFTYGIIDKKGNYIVNPQFSYLEADGDLFRCRFADGKQYGWCDGKGKIVINPQFDNTGQFFSNNLAPISLDSEKYGYADKTGKIVINPQFGFAFPFADGMSAVFVNDKAGLIDEEGKYIVNPQFDDIGARFIFMYHGYSGTNSVRSDYFDTDAIAAKVAEMASKGKIGNYSLDMPLEDIMENCGMDSSRISESPEAYIPIYDDNYWTQYVAMELFMRGDFYTEVSDGWWDYVKQIDRSRTPLALICVLKLNDQKAGKGLLLFDSIKKALGAKSDGTDKATARHNGTNVTVERDEDTVTIAMTK